MGDCIIQYSHDDAHWFGFGADAIKPPNQYTLEEANRQLLYLRDSYLGVMRWARIVGAEGNEVCKVLVGSQDPILPVLTFSADNTSAAYSQREEVI